MPSEKMRYLDFAETKLPENYLQQLERSVRVAPKDRLAELILQVAEQDVVLQFQLTARLVPMSLDEMLVFVQQVIEVVQHGRRKLNAEAQEEIAKVTDALMQRADEYVDEGKILEAAAIGFAVMLAIEPQLEKVTDEGHTLQHVISETISFLSALRDIPADPQVFALLAVTAQSLLDTIPAEDRYYEEDWRQLVKMYREKGK